MHKLGKHAYSIEDDVVYIRFVRNVDLQETVEFTRIFDEVYAKHERLFLICDLKEAELIDADARKHFGQWVKKLAVFATATVGANMLQRVLSTFIYNAVKLFNRGHILQGFFDNEADARSWLAKQRAAILAKKGKPEAS